jgi:hypothetical protein
MKELQEDNTNGVFWSGVIVCTLYLSYRYPLQINSSGTSPTYSDTPVMLQVGKFVLACPLFAIAAVRCLHKTLILRQWLVALGILFLAAYSLLKVLGDSDLKYLELSFWMLFPLALVWGGNAIKSSAIDRYFRLLLILALGSTAIQVLLFIAFGRLPALAYEGTMLIRFGGFLDDPNGFGAILFLLMGWAYARFEGWSRLFIVWGLVSCLVLTQSWTALAFLLVIWVVWLFVAVWKQPWLAMLLMCACILLGILVMRNTSLSPAAFVDAMLHAKQGSIEGHVFSWEPWVTTWSKWAMLGDTKYNAYESWWASALVNFGMPWLIVFVVLMAELLAALRRGLLIAGRESRPVYLGLLLFGCYFVLGSLSLPFPTIFPINFLFFLFSFLVVFGRIRPEDRTPPRPAEETS